MHIWSHFFEKVLNKKIYVINFVKKRQKSKTNLVLLLFGVQQVWKCQKRNSTFWVLKIKSAPIQIKFDMQVGENMLNACMKLDLWKSAK